MRFDKKEILLKNGDICILRSLKEDDVDKFIEYLKTTSNETHFMARYPEEVNTDINEQINFITNILESDKDILISAFINDELVGSTGLTCVKNHIKIKHRATLGISIKKDHWNKGIGSILIKEALNQGINMGYKQIELGVFSDNIKAKSLYEKNGFEVWGKIKNAFKLKDGTCYDEIIMGKFL